MESSDEPPSYSTDGRALSFLPRSDTLVPYQPVHMNVDDQKHAVKAIFASNKSVSSINNILGTYLSRKTINQSNRQKVPANGFYQRSKPEVRLYNHLMHKLETLSKKVLNDSRCNRANWEETLGLHRRQIFADLYNANEIVRAFAREIPGGVMTLPSLNDYALGIRSGQSYYSIVRTTDRKAGFKLLEKVRTVVLLDDSDSMKCLGHSAWSAGYGYCLPSSSSWVESRWDQARRLLAHVAPKVSEFNSHGIDLYFLNRPSFYIGLHTESEVLEAFNAGGPHNLTPTGQRINDILDGYMSTLRYNRDLMPLNLLVITDGEANDESVLHWTIQQHLKKSVRSGYPPHQLGIEFVQVGDDQSATNHLVELEEKVSIHHLNFGRDVIGVTPVSRINYMNPDVLLAILVSGIDARLNGYMRQRRINC